MKFVKFALLAVLVSCPYKSARGADTSGSSQPTGTTTGQTTPTSRATTPSTQTTSPGATAGTTPGTQAATPTSGTGPAAESGAATGTTVTLDIKKTKGTDEFDYADLDTSKLFTAKDNRVFSKIVSKNSEVWTSKDNDDAVKVLVQGKGSSKKHLALFLKSGKLTILYKDGKNKPWNDITSTKHDVSKVKFFGEGDKELSVSDYKIDIGFIFSYIVKFNDGVNCKKITYQGKDIWKHTDDENFKEIKAFSLGLGSNEFYVRKEYNISKKLELGATPVQTGTGTSNGSGTTQGSGTTTPGGQTGSSPST
ncbi:hypothetical protein TpMuguga_04g00097 [Theileria parva strain Muguga]|uniref:SfiI-subtelomeric related protein family member n=1 Tax=Theileria parva TaxID=5875 RepID=Q4N390_THEPA|nr:uncharacterized protein TpMuguga_04g00097 [Theileria parva strain Muguga]EAN31449.1 hypothetical protein TpMuguga_04g00097 [Theileria parva strain Muguga]|eukprot:XP_763732.1 hypothetical protein [Theileria parva strain Muguga]